jgi:hypothetical protein
MESGTKRPRSRARPCMTTVRKSRCVSPPRVLLYVTEDILLVVVVVVVDFVCYCSVCCCCRSLFVTVAGENEEVFLCA